MAIEDDIPEVAQDLLNKSKSAVEKANYNYAIALLLSCLRIAPNYPQARNLLHAASLKKADIYGKSILPLLIAHIMTLPFLIQGYYLSYKKNWSELLITAENILCKNPRCIPAYKLLGLAAVSSGFTKTAIDTYETIRVLRPADLYPLKKLGFIYKNQGDLEKSKKYFTDIFRIAPSDVDAVKGLKDLAAMQTIEKGRWDDQSSYRSKVKDEGQADLLEKEHRVVKSADDMDALIQDLEKRLSENPGHIKHLRDLASLYAQKGAFDQALGVFDKAIAINPRDISLQELRLQMIEQKLDHGIFSLEKNLQNSPHPGPMEKELKKLQLERREYLIQEYQNKVERYPNNLTFHFRLAQLYFEAQNIDTAIEEFQKALQDPHYRLEATHKLGQCFHSKNMYDLAIKQYHRVLAEEDTMTDLKKEVLYDLGITYLKTNQLPAALKQLTTIYEADIGFKNVSDLIQDLYKKGVKADN